MLFYDIIIMKSVKEQNTVWNLKKKIRNIDGAITATLQPRVDLIFIPKQMNLFNYLPNLVKLHHHVPNWAKTLLIKSGVVKKVGFFSAEIFADEFLISFNHSFDWSVPVLRLSPLQNPKPVEDLQTLGRFLWVSGTFSPYSFEGMCQTQGPQDECGPQVIFLYIFFVNIIHCCVK